MTKAIVLLGYRNAGKDSVCKELQRQYPGVFHNAKFGAANKQLAANLLMVDSLKFEDKKWRGSTFVGGSHFEFTPLDLLNSLFLLSDNHEGMQKQIDAYCLDIILENTIPVFTDVRRERELNKVFERFGLDDTDVYYLEPITAEESPGDEEIDDLVETSAIKKYLYSTVIGNADEILQLTKTSLLVKKPTLRLHFTLSHTFERQLIPTYEPLSTVADECKALVNKLKLEPSVLGRVFNAIYQELDLATIEIADLPAQECQMIFTEQHIPLLTKLREKANLRACVGAFTPERFKKLAKENLTKEEII